MTLKVSQRLTWYAKRLRAMSAAEIAGRVAHVAKAAAWRHRRRWENPPATHETRPAPSTPPRPFLSHVDTPNVIAEANRYISGRYSFLNIPTLEAPILWHRDPQTGRDCPNTFAWDIPYRDSAIVGNVKNVWEKSRFHHLTLLALAFWSTDDERYAREIEGQLLSWIDANPVMRGVNWASSLELGVRLIALVWIERLLRNSESHDRLFRDQAPLWTMLYWHQRVIAEYRSSGSSANNHLIGEMAGLFISATALPVFPESNGWARASRACLEREAVRQTFSSGLNREQAFAYHLFVLELLALTAYEAMCVQHPFSAAYMRAVSSMYSAIGRLQDFCGNLPRYGDGDEGTAVQLRPLASDRVEWLARLASSIGLDDPTLEERRDCDAFVDAGVYVLASRRGTPEEIVCIADAGPHGFLSIAAHGHADALSFTVNVRGQPMIVDPGTYCYHAEPEMRSYFRGTRAHNTITVDGRDQSRQAGPFLWSRQAQTQVLDWQCTSTQTRLVAEHDGYADLFGSPVHRRELSLEGRSVAVVDLLEGSGRHEVEWRLHFAPGCGAVIQDDECIVVGTPSDLRIRVSLDQRFEWSLLQGESDGGWFSPAFNVILPSPTLRGRCVFEFPERITTSIAIA